MARRRPFGWQECAACDGTGDVEDDFGYVEDCPKCKGEGQVNVIEMFDYPAPLGDEGGP